MNFREEQSMKKFKLLTGMLLAVDRHLIFVA